ncbi:hypothetical protein LB467_09830 [Salegentibacter sp. JZCK2]|uniref:hypothetical protein n=1 Tax=Salegentibacter tibetensis TaxID=2873600 RepID=UPI001CC98F57|nr:hypothetical protein [Salegentibacter tibetensis]MBZ9729984.1 hypothetical protein [Salegentibacter tibetensis]
MIHRRKFIKLAFVACSIAPGFNFTSKEKLSIGLQLYSLRETINDNPKQILKTLADIGFNEIETYGYNKESFWGLGCRTKRRTLKKNRHLLAVITMVIHL